MATRSSKAHLVAARRLAAGLAWWLAAACADGSGEPLRIGIVLDGDGERGAQLAAEDINAAGGIRGRRLELRAVHGSSTTQAREALTAAESLASDPTVLAVVGHTNSAASLAGAQIYNARRVVQIAPTSTAPLYSEAGRYSFRMVASDSHQGAFLANAITRSEPVPSIALLYVNDDYGRALQAILVKELTEKGHPPVYQAPFAERERFTAIEDVARAIAQARPRLLVWIGRGPELRRLLPQLRERLPSLSVLASDGLSRSYVIGDTTATFTGVRYVRFFDVDQPPPAVAALRRRYAERWPEELSDQYLLAYDAVRLLGEAMRAGGDNRDAIREYLESLGRTRPEYPALAGPLSFDLRGDPRPRYALVEITRRGAR